MHAVQAPPTTATASITSSKCVRSATCADVLLLLISALLFPEPYPHPPVYSKVHTAKMSVNQCVSLLIRVEPWFGGTAFLRQCLIIRTHCLPAPLTHTHSLSHSACLPSMGLAATCTLVSAVLFLHSLRDWLRSTVVHVTVKTSTNSLPAA